MGGAAYLRRKMLPERLRVFGGLYFFTLGGVYFDDLSYSFLFLVIEPRVLLSDGVRLKMLPPLPTVESLLLVPRRKIEPFRSTVSGGIFFFSSVVGARYGLAGL